VIVLSISCGFCGDCVFATTSAVVELKFHLNPCTDEQLNLLGTVPEQVCNFSPLPIFCLGCKTISRRAARWLIGLHPKHNVESEKKLTCKPLWRTKLLFVS